MTAYQQSHDNQSSSVPPEGDPPLHEHDDGASLPSLRTSLRARAAAGIAAAVSELADGGTGASDPTTSSSSPSPSPLHELDHNGIDDNTEMQPRGALEEANGTSGDSGLDQEMQLQEEMPYRDELAEATSSGANETREAEEGPCGRCANSRLWFLIVVLIAAIAVAVAVPISMSRTGVAAKVGADPGSVGVEASKTSAAPTERPTVSHIPTMLPTSRPTSSLLPQTVDMLMNISGESLLQEGTSANLAFDWILNRDPQRRSPDDPRFVQRYILALFLLAIRDGRSSLLTGDDECEWGIWRKADDRYSKDLGKIFSSCGEDDGMVFAIDMGGEKLVSIEDEIISGTIPAELASLPHLQSLSLDNLGLHGTVPDSVFGLGTLRKLSVSKNMLTGTIPKEVIGRMGRALEDDTDKVIGLDGNLFEGTIPEELGNIKGLKRLKLHKNNFVGTIPAALCHLGSEPLVAASTTTTSPDPSSFSSAPPPAANASKGANVFAPGLGQSSEDESSNALEGGPINNLTSGSRNDGGKNGEDEEETASTSPSIAASTTLALLTSDCAEVNCSCSPACRCFFD